MVSWEIEAVDLINRGLFEITDPGPLHAPIRGFVLSRNDDLALILETNATPDAKTDIVQPPTGTVRFNKDLVKLAEIGGNEATLTGIQSFNVTISHGHSQQSALRECARIHELTVTLDDPGKAAYTIEWLENLPLSPFIWPDSITTITETSVTCSIALLNGGLTLSNSSSGHNSSQNAAKLTVAGQTLFVCAQSTQGSDAIKRGSIVYIGTPDDLIRKKIRNALSFALGFYLVELGHTLYDQDWHIVAATSRSAYSLAKRTFDPSPMPLAHLSSRSFQHDLGHTKLTQMVDALVANYDQLDLGNLSWAYWHAGTATVHIAPAHFGAAIEALQEAYCKSHPNIGKTKILPTAQWKGLRETINGVIEAALINEDNKGALKEKLQDINRPPQRVILKSVLEAMGIELGAAENEAWKRRNDAAHGTPIPEGEELAAIRDMKLLRGLFNRMLLRMTNAADNYVDYVTPGHAIRYLQDPVPST